MDLDRLCLSCRETLSDEWARSDQKYCNDSCKMKFWYAARYKKFYDSRYKKFKRQWEKSPNGKRAGILISEWLKMPKSWR